MIVFNCTWLCSTTSGFALAQHEGLREANDQLLPCEHILAFLDDLYLITTRVRALESFKLLTAAVEAHAGVRTNLGKLRMWSPSGGPAPDGVANLGDHVWCADKPASENGLKCWARHWALLLTRKLFSRSAWSENHICWRKIRK